MANGLRLVAWLLLAGSVALSSQTATPPVPQTPTFRLNVEYVEVDAVVADGNGQFVRGLTQEDFEILEDGQPQPITAFALVDIPVARLSRPIGAPEPFEPDVQSNETPFNGRVYVMVLDDLHTAFARTQAVRAAGRRFIQQHLGANDLMAVVHTAAPTDANQEFTSNKRLLLAAVDRALGQKVPSPTLAAAQAARGASDQEPLGLPTDPTELERQANARRSLRLLRDVADWFSTIRGRRKAILFVSEGIGYDVTDLTSTGAAAAQVLDSMRDTLAAAARGNVAIYAIDPRGLTSLAGDSIELGSLPVDPDGAGNRPFQRELMLSQSSLRQLADDTGGFAVVNANDFGMAFDRIVRDNSAYYAMAYYPPSDKAGRAHKIEVRVRRPGLLVRARRGYVTQPAADRSGDLPLGPDTTVAGGTYQLTAAVRDALASPLPLSGLAVRVFAAPFKGAGSSASVLLGVEARGRDLRLERGGRLAVTQLATDADGKIRNGTTDAISLALSPEVGSRVAASALRFLKRLELSPGRYQLRVVAHETASGAVGSVLYDLEIPDFARLPLSMSGLVLTLPRGVIEPTVRVDEMLRPLLPGPPIAARTFFQNTEIALFAEIYDNEGSTPHRVDLGTTVATEDGQVVFTSGETRDSSELQGPRGGYGYAPRLSTTELAPGRYVLTVSARSRLGDSPAVQRQIQFTVIPPPDAGATPASPGLASPK